jgi:hypothetical protein
VALFRSKFTNFRQKVRSPYAVTHPITGVVLESKPGVYAEFGVLGPEQTIVNPETGEVTTSADIRGGFFDSDEAAERFNWDAEMKETVEMVLRRELQRRPEFGEEILPVHVPAELPWPTYDAFEPEQVVRLAEELQLVGPTVAYERENLQRADVLVPLLSLLDGLGDDEKRKAEPRTAVDLSPAKKGGGVKVGSAPQTTRSGIVKSTPGLVLNPETPENPAAINLE